MQLTEQQRAAIESVGRTIVSASAGSGKTFVMIKKLVAAIENGVDADNVLAVTFTKKAAAQMKDKLRSAIIERLEGADEKMRARLKLQLSKIPTANISTIHAFCAKLLRKYFYTAGIDGTFGIIAAEDAEAKEYKNRALDSMFERYYASDNPDFKTLLSCYRKKRSDEALKKLILDSYDKLRITARYGNLLDGVKDIYTEEGFQRVKGEFERFANGRYSALKKAVENFSAEFVNSNAQVYSKIFGEMTAALDSAKQGGIFAIKPPLTLTRKPVDRKEEDKLSGEAFKAFKEELTKKYNAVTGDLEDEESERKYFFESGKVAVAFANILKDFDAQYTAVKRDENKLDYNDLEHLTLQILDDDEVCREINSGFSCVFVDEYQDVNPVQEEIITRVGGENLFLVGDVKQAIYGFRGSKSLFFAEKYNRFEGGNGSALRLSNNFRSSDGVIDFVNSAFSRIMTAESCGFDYSSGSMMKSGGGYPAGDGEAQIHIFGKDSEEKVQPGIYSVQSGSNAVRHTREGLAVLSIVERELKSKHFDLKTGEYVDTQAGDICILTRKKGNASTMGIVRALTDAGYAVSGAQEANICTRPEVRQMLDILSFIDNNFQDIPLTTSLLSPLGGLTCDELAAIRIAAKNDGRTPFRDCCKKYAERFNNEISKKLVSFGQKAERLRDLAEVFTAAEIIDKILEETGLEAAYSARGGERLKNIRRLSEEAEGLSVQAFLKKVRDGGYEISAPAPASSESIKIMTMHASKGLEFPVVIISDICATFKGRENNDLPFDENFGFAHKYFDRENMLTHTTLLRRLDIARCSAEELKNELNLFYVACTRAMCRLHIMAQDDKTFSPVEAMDAKCYASLIDMNRFFCEQLPARQDFIGGASISPLISSPDPELKERISGRFMKQYAHADCVNLPVKSSASAILRLSEEDSCFIPHSLYSGEGETGTDRGTAYHRFLELCDFKIKDRQEISVELDKMVKDGHISLSQRALVDEGDLAQILNMPVFSRLDGAELFREREFLCRLPAAEVFKDTASRDEILIQGAIDLLAVTQSGIRIIDYKYSRKSDEELIRRYSGQLELYKRAVSTIMHVDAATISTAIVNIYLKRQIILN